MATAKKVTGRFEVTARINLMTGIMVSAPSLDDALEQAKTLKVGDFIDIHGEHLDSTFTLAGVSSSTAWENL